MPEVIQKLFHPFGRLFGTLISSVRLNAISFQRRDGRATVLKRRNPFGRHITPIANWFFRQARAPISFFRDTQSWQHWEVHCFRLLNRPYRAAPAGPHAVREDKLPGDNLWEHIKRGTLTRRMLIAAGHELRRAHSLHSEVYNDLWSHGDGAMRNVLYDPATRRARLIDFELLHDPALPAPVRQADDLLAFLLDLASGAPRRLWQPYAICFLRAYRNRAPIEELRKRLIVPRGIPWLWWKVRTNFVKGGKVERRLARLRRALDHGALNHSSEHRNSSKHRVVTRWFARTRKTVSQN